VAVRNVLFLCTGNSARSILAEALLNHRGKNRYRAFSAGSHPKAEVHPLALETLRKHHIPFDEARTKSWNEFAKPGAPVMDFVFTVCDNAAGEVCPVWPGHPIAAHWGIEDPAAVTGSDEERRRAFTKALGELDTRIQRLTTLRLESLDPVAIKRELDRIGHATGDPKPTT
jgi:arsenate reductase